MLGGGICEVLYTHIYCRGGRSRGPSGATSFWIVHCPWHPVHVQNCPLYLLVLRTAVFPLPTLRAGVTWPESGQKMGLQERGEQDAPFSPGTFFSHVTLQSLRLYPFTDGWHPFVVAAESIYFLLLFCYMVVQVRVQGAQIRGLIPLPSHLQRWGAEARGKGLFVFLFCFVVCFCPRRLPGRPSVVPECQSRLLQEGPGLVFPRNRHLRLGPC